jgi:hypothetical protein
MNMQNNTDLKGLSGWLILVGIGLIFSVFRLAYLFIPLYYSIFTNGTFDSVTTPGTTFYNPFWGALLIFEAVFNSLLTLTYLYLAYLFFSKHYLFPKIYIATLTAAVIFIPLDAWFVSLIMPGQPTFDVNTVKEFMRGLVSATLWIPYMLVSKRVKATFVESRPEAKPNPVVQTDIVAGNNMGSSD